MVARQTGELQETPTLRADGPLCNARPEQPPVLGSLKEPVTRVFSRKKRARQGSPAVAYPLTARCATSQRLSRMLSSLMRRHEGQDDVVTPAMASSRTLVSVPPARQQGDVTATPAVRHSTAPGGTSVPRALPTGARKATQLYLNCGQVSAVPMQECTANADGMM